MTGIPVLYCCCPVLVLVLLTISNPSLQQDAIFGFTTPAEVINTTEGRIRGVRNRLHKDFVIGGLFPIHTAIHGGGGCGEVMLERGVERMEAMLYAIDVINADESLLRGFTLGYDIRDTCTSENIGLDEAVDLLITKNNANTDNCYAGSSTASNISTIEEKILENPVSGIIGAASSHISASIASLGRLFTTPQISYASTSTILTNRDLYSYFYRTVPPDSLQAQAMIDLLVFFNWTYISAIYSRNTYGEPGINEVRTLAEQKGICIDLYEGINDNFSDNDFSDLAKKLDTSVANVVILFAHQNSAHNLLKHLKKLSSRKFTWIASDSWTSSPSALSNYDNIFDGIIGFLPLTKHFHSFDEYFSKLTLNSNNRNPWFEEFFSASMNCNSDNSLNEKAPCNRNSSIPELKNYEQGNMIPFVVDAVYVYAYALQNFLTENCEKPIQWFISNKTCLNQMRELNGSTLLEYINKSNFTSPTGNKIVFDNEGNVEGMFEILNYQVIHSDEEGGTADYVFKRVGIWDSSTTKALSLGTLKLSPVTDFQFSLDSINDEDTIFSPISQCERCYPGQFQRQVKSYCCGFCEPCLGEFFSNDSLAPNCSICKNESWGNSPMNGSDSCVVLKESFLSFSHPYSIIIIIISIAGLVAAAVTFIVFIKFWNTPVVKSSGREQMIILIVGITLSFITAFFYISTPSAAVCGIQVWMRWISLSIMFSALLVKIIRVARIFLQKVKLKRPRFTEPHYQVLFTAILVLLQLIILVISTSIDHPQVMRETRRNPEMPNAFPTVVITCWRQKTVFLVLSVGYESILIGLCTILGSLSFSYPENFNEAKYVSLCAISIVVIWIAYMISFFATASMQELQNIVISLSVVMSAYAVLFSIFGHKLFVILFRPEQNIPNWSKNLTNDSLSKNNPKNVSVKH